MFQLVATVVRCTASVVVAVACASMAVSNRKAHRIAAQAQTQSTAPATK